MSTYPPFPYTRAIRWLIYLLIIFAGLTISAAFIWTVSKAPPTITDVSVNSSVVGLKEHVHLPYTINGEDNEKLSFTIKLQYKSGQATYFYVVPDDCVEIFNVNKERVKLTAQANAQRCNWQTGFGVDLQPYLHEGENSIFIEVRNKNGKMGLRFSTDSDLP